MRHEGLAAPGLAAPGLLGVPAPGTEDTIASPAPGPGTAAHAVTVFIGIGSNVEPEYHVAASLERLALELGDLRTAPWYRSPSVGFIGEPFINTVCTGTSHHTLAALVERLRRIEVSFGRERAPSALGSRHTPRTVDLDLLFYGSLIRHSETLTLPRDDIERYAFVLQPLADIAWSLVHPVSGIRIGDLLVEQRTREPARFNVLERVNAGQEIVPRPQPVPAR